MLKVDLMREYAQACSSGSLTWPAFAEGTRADDVRAFCLTTLLTVLRGIDPGSGTPFLVIVAGHDQAPAAIMLPGIDNLLARDKHALQAIKLARVPPLQALLAHFINHGDAVLDWLGRPIRRFATYLFPPAGAHLGHYLWNELPGLEYAAEHIPAPTRPLVFSLSASAAGEFFGPIEDIFPELVGLVRRQCRDMDSMLAYSYPRGLQAVRFSGRFVSARLSERLKAVVAAHAARTGLYDKAEGLDLTADADAPVIVLGLRVENRTHADLATFYCRIIDDLLRRYRALTLIIDGHNAKLGAGPVKIFPSFLEQRAAKSPVAVEREIVAALQEFADGKPVNIVDCVGTTTLENLFWIDLADLFVAPWGAGLAKYRWAINKIGYVFTSAINLRKKEDLNIYSSAEYMETPSETIFVIADKVRDLPEAEVLVPVTVGGAGPFYVNFTIEASDISGEIADLCDRAMRQNPHRLADRPRFHKDKLRIENDVLFGGNGQLFLASGGHHVLDWATRRRHPHPTSLRNFESNIRRRAALAQQIGARYLHLMFPDKQSVLSDAFPVKNIVRLGETYLNHCPDLADTILYPVDALRQTSVSTFRATDTHLNDFGSIVTVVAALDRLYGSGHQCFVKRLSERCCQTQQWCGDLGGKLAPNLSSTEKLFVPNWKFYHVSNHAVLTGGNDGLVDILINSDSLFPDRIAMFGDSFLRNCLTIFSFFFREIVFFRTRFLYDDFIDALHPDAILTANVERYLSNVEDDETRPYFALAPYLNGIEYIPNKEFAEAFSAMLAHGRPAYRRFLDQVMFG